jgi:hypothetical protein
MVTIYNRNQDGHTCIYEPIKYYSNQKHDKFPVTRERLLVFSI